MTTGTSDRSIDRLALAREVISGAGNVLAAAGFDRAEIAAFFLQAAELLGATTGAPVAVPEPAGQLAEVVHQFAGCEPLRELLALAAEAHPLLPLGEDVPPLRAAFDIAMRMTPLLAEAQRHLRTLADAAGLPLVATATQADNLDEPVVCIEAFAGAYAAAVEVYGAVCEALVARQDGEAFGYLLGHLAECGVIIAGPLQARLARGADLLG